MRSSIAALAFLGVSTLTGIAWPCGPAPVGNPVRPVGVIRPTIEDARFLLREAAEADVQASRDEADSRSATQRAVQFEQRADQSLSRAARLSHGSRERARLLREADLFQTEAAISRADAGQLLASAASLRHHARDLRAQARQITAGFSTPVREPRIRGTREI
jgi:hypothetical protein